jgi:hypothetical protein
VVLTPQCGVESHACALWASLVDARAFARGHRGRIRTILSILCGPTLSVEKWCRVVLNHYGGQIDLVSLDACHFIFHGTSIVPEINAANIHKPVLCLLEQENRTEKSPHGTLPATFLLTRIGRWAVRLQSDCLRSSLTFSTLPRYRLSDLQSPWQSVYMRKCTRVTICHFQAFNLLAT